MKNKAHARTGNALPPQREELGTGEGGRGRRALRNLVKRRSKRPVALVATTRRGVEKAPRNAGDGDVVVYDSG